MVGPDRLDGGVGDVLVSAAEERQDRTGGTAELTGDVTAVERGGTGQVQAGERGPIADRSAETEAGDPHLRRSEVPEPLDGLGEVGLHLVGCERTNEGGAVGGLAPLSLIHI